MAITPTTVLPKKAPAKATLAAKKKATLDNLELMRVLIKKYGWIQGSEGDREMGFCLIGANHEADGWGERLAWLALDTIVKHDQASGKFDKMDIFGVGTPIDFNDSKGTQRRDVLGLIARGIALVKTSKKIVKNRFVLDLPPVKK